MFPDHDVRARPTGDCAFLLDVARQVMEQDDDTRDLFHPKTPGFDLTMGLERFIVSCTMRIRDIYHLQINDLAYISSGQMRKGPTIEPVQSRLSYSSDGPIFSPALRRMLEKAKGVTKWEIYEVPELSRWSNECGNMMQLMDSRPLPDRWVALAHSFKPTKLIRFL